ncbi:hypothetical protein PT974_00094 [Cladobotryum mycophilum]|uniref:Tat pathway signal sequence n=1 Tax=Cladobotryum mycophilum TaxID=491253 RepID=A0ABR0T000_9HYPO
MDLNSEDGTEDEIFKDDSNDIKHSLLHQDFIQSSPRKRSQFHKWVAAAAVCHLSLLLILGAVLAWAADRSHNGRPFGVNLVQSPAREAVVYERLLVNNDLDAENPFKGEPQQHNNDAWNDLVKYQYSAVLPSQLGPGQESIQVNDGTDRVLITLDVFHNLNCLNDIRRYIFRSYFNESSSSSNEASFGHLNNCVDMIRQSLMCHGDIAVGTYTWKPDHLTPWPDFRIFHECRNWDEIFAWAKEHRASSVGEEDISWV